MKVKYYVYLLLVVILAGCEFDNSTINYTLGSDFVSAPATIVMTDTLTLNTYTTVIDTFKTSGATRLLAGRFVNQYGFETVCESYFRVDPCGSTTLHKRSAQFDSLCLVLYLDGYSFGDTTQIANFEVYRVIEEIKEDPYKEIIYNTKQFKSSESPIGTFSVNLEDDDCRDSLVIRLSDELGQTLFNMAFVDSFILSDFNLFKEEYFNGLSIKPALDNSTLVFGIDASPNSSKSPAMRVYYSDNTIARDQYFEFPLEENIRETNFLVYNYIRNFFDKSIVAGSNITSADNPNRVKLSSLETENVTFLQGGLMYTRIEIPEIREYHYSLGIGAIIKAELIIKPLEGTFSEKSQLPEQLVINLVDSRNYFYDRMYAVGTEDVEYGVLHYNFEFPSESYYTYDITNFIQTEYRNTYDQLYDLLLIAPYDAVKPNVSQLIIGDFSHPKNDIKLKLYISSYNNSISQ